MITIYAFFLLLTKHFLIDFMMQPKWMYANKGTWMHPGGIAHATLHGIGTLTVLSLFLPINFLTMYILYAAVLEVFAHYFIDYAKVNICKENNWKADNSEQFWYMLGLDQWFHNLCYIGIVKLVLFGL